MIISMYKKVCVTDRKLVPQPENTGSFLRQIDRILQTETLRPDFLILREKDMSEEAYAKLAAKVQAKCTEAGVPCFFNGRPELAAAMKADGVHLSFPAYMESPAGSFTELPSVGVSVHSTAEAAAAEQRGADYLIYGHVFETDCKPGIPGRGLDALGEICETAGIPVFAIGGVSVENAKSCIERGAAGICMMSGYMRL